MPITVPIAGQEISASAFGIPVANEVNRMTPVTTVTAWTALSLTNGWANVGGWGSAQYRKVGDMVQLRGVVSGGTANSSVATLPAGFRPPDQITVPYAVNGSGANYLSLTPTGTIQPFVAGYCSLSGIAFSITP